MKDRFLVAQGLMPYALAMGKIKAMGKEQAVSREKTPVGGVAGARAKVVQELDNERLDRALKLLAPDMGLRGRRRLFEHCRVLVDGRERGKGFRVRQGQTIELVPLRESQDGESVRELLAAVKVLDKGAAFAALYKPGKLHSAHVAGSPEPSVEGMLSRLFPNRDAVLLNRLDKETSGILLLAFGHEPAMRYSAFQEQGLALKRYLAVVRGRPEPGQVLDRKLVTGGGERVRVLEEAADRDRQTKVEGALPAETGLSVILVNILKGARHQVRAHLAHAGFPILGDRLYSPSEPLGMLHLHHALFSMPGLNVASPPPWKAYGSIAQKLMEQAS